VDEKGERAILPGKYELTLGGAQPEEAKAKSLRSPLSARYGSTPGQVVRFSMTIYSPALAVVVPPPARIFESAWRRSTSSGVLAVAEAFSTVFASACSFLVFFASMSAVIDAILAAGRLSSAGELIKVSLSRDERGWVIDVRLVLNVQLWQIDLCRRVDFILCEVLGGHQLENVGAAGDL
jgi:hypothetical protein